MPKIRSQAGISLSDLYDVEGSIVGIEELISREVHLSHEMGAAVFSERLVARLRRMTTGDIAQNTDFSLQIADLPAGGFRVLGVDVIADAGLRVNHAVVSMHSPGANFGQDFPLWTFDQDFANTGRTVRMVDDDNAEANLTQLAPQLGMANLPSMGFGVDQRFNVPNIVFRGTTAGFGAGTVEVIALIYVAAADAGSGLSSRGLPLPSW